MSYRLRHARPSFAPRPLVRALAACSLLTLWHAGGAAQVLPGGLKVVNGQAQVSTAGSAMTVTNSANAILNWQSFSIGAGGSVRFQQPGASSAVLNRVVGSDPSSILGALSSNGQVWLLNPNGVIFGQSARVDVAGLVTSTLRLNDLDWLNGRFSLSADGGEAAGIVNQGELHTTLGGRIALVGGSVRNEGLIDAPGGQVVLAAGQSVELIDTGAPHLGVRVTAPGGEAVNLGQLLAAGGRIDIHAAAVNQQGIVSASALEAGRGGEVMIKASGRTTLADGSRTSATSADGAGGAVTLLGAEVGLLDGSRVDVSGRTGGGEVLVGGGLQGKDPSVPNAQAVYFGPGASILADATVSGDGGRIILWSDAATRAFGSLSARGGTAGGDGGFIETSGGWLDARPAAIDLTAPLGKAGMWLLDPNDILIQSGPPGTVNISGNPDFTTTNDSAVINDGTIVAALNAGNNVTITTGSQGTNAQAGDIRMLGASIVTNAPNAVSLTLTADRNIRLDLSIIDSGAGAPLDVTFLAARGGQGTIEMYQSFIFSGGGDILLGGLTTAVGPSASSPWQGALGYDDGSGQYGAGILITSVEGGSQIDAGTGTLTIRGASVATETDAYGVYISPSSTLDARVIDIQGWVNSAGSRVADSADPVAFPDGEFTIREGVEIFGSVTSTESMTIVGTAISPVFRGDTVLSGVSIEGVLSAGTDLAITGTMSDLSPTGGTDWVRRAGVILYADSDVSSGGGDITITGIDQSADTFYYGIYGDGGTIHGAINGSVFLASAERTRLDSTSVVLTAATDAYISGSDVILDDASITDAAYLSIAGDQLVHIRNFTSIDTLGRIDITSANGDILVENSGISNTPSLPGENIDLLSAGRQYYSGATLTSAGADITLAGDTLIDRPLGGSADAFGALASDPDGGQPGIDIRDASNISASGAGNLRIIGGSLATGSSGVSIAGDSTLSARQIYIVGTNTADGGTGVALSSSQVLASRDIEIEGLGEALGVSLSGDFELRLQPSALDPGGTLRILGEDLSLTANAGYGVSIDARSATSAIGAPISASNGAIVTIRGESDNYGVWVLDDPALTAPAPPPAPPPRPTIEVVGGGTISVGSLVSLFSVYTDPLFEGAWLSGDGAIDIAGSFEVVVRGFSRIEAEGGISVTSGGRVVINDSTLSTVASAGNISILSTAWQEIYDSTLSSNGGNITLGGPTTVDLPLGGGTFDAALADVGSGSGTGIDIVRSTIGTTGGELSIRGASLTSSGVGVSIDQSSLLASQLVIQGNSGFGFTGVQILTSDLTATDAYIQGLGGYYGVDWYTGEVVSMSVTAGGSLYVAGESVGFNGIGVEMDSVDATSAALIVATNADVVILGKTQRPQDSAIWIVEDPSSVNLTIDVGGGNLTIGDGNADTVTLSDIRLSAIGAGTGTVSLNTAGSLDLTNVQVDATRAIGVQTPFLTTAGTTTITSVAVGDAIVLAGGDGVTPMSNWANSADPLTVLATPTPGGRWLAHFTDVTATGDYPTGLPYAFKLYNALPGDGASDGLVGNGLVFSAAVSTAVTATVQTKVYDGTTTAQVSNVNATGINGDQFLSASVDSADFVSASAGTNIEVTLGGVVLSFEDTNRKPVYGYQFTSNLAGDIEQAALLLSGLTAQNKVYDTTTLATLVGTASVTGVGSDDVSVTGTGSGSFADKNVGTGKSVSVSGYTLTGADAGNYTLTLPGSLVADITAADLVVGGISALDKVYDATTAATLAGTATVTALLGDVVTVGGSGTGAFDDKNVGTGKTVSVSGYTLGGTDAGNYNVLQPTGLTASITQADLAVTGVTAQDKVYDATTAATLAGTATVTALLSDVVTVSGPGTGTFADKNVGTGKAVSVSGYTLGGTDAGNYNVLQPAGVTASITQADLTVTGVTALDKVYDATTVATLAGTATVTALGSDVVTLSGPGTGTFDDKNVGTGKAVSVSGYTLGGTDAGNYNVLQPTGLTASVTAAPLTVTGFTAQDKVYDATTVATLLGSGSFSALLGDDVAISGTASASFADKNVGVAKAVNLSGLTLSGVDAGNYTLNAVAGLSADITQADLAVTGVTALDKVYDATTAATLAGTATVTALLSDVVTVSGPGTGTFADKNVGTGKAVSVSGYTLGGTDAGNYNVLQPAGVTASITQADLTVTGVTALDKVYDATTAATLAGTATVTALLSDVVTLSGPGTGTFDDKNVGTGKTVSVSGYTLGGTDAGNYNVLQPTGLTASVTAAPLTVTGFTAQDKVYDATTAATLVGTGSFSALPGDDVTISGTASASFADKNVGVAKAINLTGLTLSGVDAGNYTLNAVAGLSADITQADLAVTGVTALDKVYDATTAATLAGTATVTALLSDVVTVSGPGTGTFADKNVGTGKAVSVSGFTLTGTDAGNYNVLQPTGLTASITQADLTVTGVTALDKVYDATTVATLAGTATVTALGSDVVTLSGPGTGTFDDKNVGTGKAVSVSGYTLGGTDAGNYNVLQPTDLTASVTAAPLTVTGFTAQDKVYDATTAATLVGTGSFSALPGDDVAISGTASASFADKNVGVAKAINLTGLTLSGVDAGNYTLDAVVGLSADITPLALAVTGVTVLDKVYDATTAATLVGTPTYTPLPGDAFNLVLSSTGSFADKNVGTGKTVTYDSASLTGGDAGNYAIDLTLPTASITAAPLAVAGLSGGSKVYDATTSVTLLGTAAINPFAGDVVNLLGTVSGATADKNVGTALPVAVSGLSIGGGDAGNYVLTLPGDVTVDVLPRPLTVSGLTAQDKVYDTTTAATLSGTASVTPLGSDSVTVSGSLTGAFADKNVGTAKTVSVGSFSLGGADAGNYTLLQPSLFADITPATLTVSGLSAADKVYDATTAATLSGSTSVTPLGNDIVSLAGTLTGFFSDKNVGTAKSVSISSASLTGADAGNYTLVQPGLSADITPATLTIVGLSATDKVYDGTTVATLGGTASVTALGGDLVTVTGQGSASFADKNVGLDKSVTVSGFTLAGADAGNYRVGQISPLSADITPATLLYVADPRAMLAGQPLPVLTGSVSGFAGGDTLASATSGSLAFEASVYDPVPAGTYAVYGYGLAATNYTFDQAAGNATALTVIAGLPPEVIAETAVTQSPEPMRRILQWVPAPKPDPAKTGLADVVTSLPPLPGGTVGAALAAAAASFGSVNLGTMSPGEVRVLLETRDSYKKRIFAESIARLEADPTLADLPKCSSLKDALAGTCLITEDLRIAFRDAFEREQRLAQAALPTPQPVAPPAAPAAPGAQPPAAAPAPAAAAVAAAAAPKAPVLPERKRVLAAALPQIERKVALLIGGNQYADPAIPTLTNAVGDVRAMARLFESQLGYETVVLENAGKSEVVAAMNRLALELKPHDSVVVYYAGHGELVPATKLGYWQLADADSKRPETWLSNADISRVVAAMPSSQVSLISDSCYSGSLVAENRIRASTAPVDPIALLTRKTVVVMSSGGNEPVSDAGKDGHSPFAYSLMQTLGQVKEWSPGGRVFERVRFAVARAVPQRPQYGASSAAGHQAGGDYLFEQRSLEE